MDCLTGAIHDNGGFVFNYAGDGIAAMWNAPSETSTHAQDACRAAIEMHGGEGQFARDNFVAAFKAFALALRAAVARTGHDDVPSTKGVLA